MDFPVNKFKYKEAEIEIRRELDHIKQLDLNFIITNCLHYRQSNTEYAKNAQKQYYLP